MNGKPFLDTNILLYAFSDDPRADRAEAVLRSGGIISVQVLNEFVNVSRLKMKRPWDEIDAALLSFRHVLDAPVPLTAELHDEAVALCRGARLAFYDALIVAAAIQSGCSILYTEDMQHGRRIGGTTIQNPFLS